MGLVRITMPPLPPDYGRLLRKHDFTKHQRGQADGGVWQLRMMRMFFGITLNNIMVSFYAFAMGVLLGYDTYG